MGTCGQHPMSEVLQPFGQQLRRLNCILKYHEAGSVVIYWSLDAARRAPTGVYVAS